jgi:hypothetical protein
MIIKITRFSLKTVKAGGGSIKMLYFFTFY